MSDSDQTMLKDAVFQVLNYHQNFDVLLQETSSISSLKPEGLTQECTDILKSCLRGQTDSASTFHTSETCAMKILQITYKSDLKTKTYTTLSQQQKEELKAVLKTVKDLINEQSESFHKPRFLNLLCKEDCLPLEVLWMLDKEGVMMFDAYLSFKHSDSKFIYMVSDQLCKMCCTTSEKTNDTTFKTDMISKLIEFGYPERTDVESSPLKKLSMAVLDDALKKLVELLLSGTVSCMLPLCTRNMLYEGSVKKLYTHALSVILGYQASDAVRQALEQQISWTYAKLPSGILEWFKQLLMPFETTEVLDIIQNILDRQEVNWKLLLGFLSTFVVCEVQACNLIYGFVNDFLKVGFENSEYDKIELGFLIGRQCCLEGPHVFMTYLDWFQKMFGDSTRSPANNRKSFTLLIRFLNDTVPSDPPLILRTHILRPPFVPPKCRELFSDYIMLAKTRLSDLKQPLDAGGGVSDDTSNYTDKQKMLDLIEQDIQKALYTFEASGKIPTSVMEASIFRKPYFVGRYLPILLKPRPLPDVPDVKMKFIKALHRVDKIPASLYNNYKEKCKQETTRLIEGVFMEVDDDVEEEMSLEPLEQYHFRLDQLIDCVVKGHTSNDIQQFKVSEIVSMIREKISYLLELSENDNSTMDASHDSHVTVDTLNADLPTKHLQIVDGLLNTFCRLTEVCLNSENPDFVWATQLIDVVLEFRALLKGLFTRIWKLVAEQGPTLQSHHIAGLAAIESLLSTSSEKIGFSVSKGCERHSNLRGLSTLNEQLWNYLSFQFKAWLEFSLRFTTMYLQFLFSCFDDVSLAEKSDLLLPASLLKKFIFLCWRFLPELRGNTCGLTHQMDDNMLPYLTLAHEIYTSGKFQQYSDHIKLNFEDWVMLELSVCPDSDNLPAAERREYLNWCIYNKFMSMPLDDGGCCHDYRVASSILFRCVAHTETSIYVPRVAAECPKCTQHGIRQGYSTTWTVFMPILLEMSYNISKYSNVEGHEVTNPWLIEQLMYLLNQTVNNNNVTIQVTVKVFSRISLCLPAYLFFCDDVTQLKEQSIKSSCDVINHHFRHYLTIGCCLPSSITVYLLQGLTQCCRRKDITAVLMESRLLSLSILMHYEQTGSFVDHLSVTSNSENVDVIKRMIEWLHRCNICIELPDMAASPWITSAALFSLTVKSADIAREVVTQMINSNTRQGFLREVLDIYIVLVTAHISYKSVFCTAENVKMLKELERILCMLLFFDTSSLKNITMNTTVDISIFIPESLQRLHHYTILRILCTQEPDKLLELEDGLSCLVVMLSDVTKLFDSTDTSESTSDQTFTIQSLLEMTKFVKECFMKADFDMLSRLNKDQVSSCGPELMLIIGQRLHKM